MLEAATDLVHRVLRFEHPAVRVVADFVRGCIWAIPTGDGGRPEPDRIELVRRDVASPVRLLTGPGGDLFYLDFVGGALHRIRYVGS